MLRFLTAGESHGQAILAVIESFPAGFEISVDEINRHLSRRQMGYGRGVRMRIEKDRVKIISGLRNGRTLGSPIACLIENRDWPNWKMIMDPVKPVAQSLSDKQRSLAFEMTAPRPGHVDLAGAIKYHTHNLRDVLERASARETAARVAAGSIARQLLGHFGMEIASHVIAVGKAKARRKRYDVKTVVAESDRSTVRCLDPTAAEKMVAEIRRAASRKDTVGGVFEIIASGVPVGLGSNAEWHVRIDASLAAALMSIQSVKGVEIGDGFAAATQLGSRVHDPIDYHPKSADRTKGFLRRSNRAGGIEGGLTNGADIVIRAACKPISTLMQPLDTVDIVTKQPANAIVERSDICVVPAAAVVGEAMVAMALASAFTDKFGGDSRREMEDNFNAYLNREF